jgi:hypothetical protein
MLFETRNAGQMPTRNAEAMMMPVVKRRTIGSMFVS